ncbi:MAG: WYL domain-containing protein [Bacteroidales bacterium]|nr:WYL domain-containing protein [Bacteroidales bacterium]MBD5172394.1 WYL domain-containing protein [Bacteroidales bacterium]MDE6231295.1 WYL domain-containing protein [Muribaculaceae bacterium]
MNDLINRYIWIVDTLSRYGRLTRNELNDLWVRSPRSDGRPIPARTFYHYRRAIEENFHIDILCDSTGHYHLDGDVSPEMKRVTDWLLESTAVNNAMNSASLPADRVAVEDVPSAREFLPLVLTAITDCAKISFTYAGFSRSRPEENITFHPYFVKRYKQRWYMIGWREKSSDIRTYALDRVKKLVIMSENFEMPDITPAEFFSDLIGITFSRAETRTVRIMTTPVQAKYFRALPFHVSQQESLGDKYSIFTFRLKLNYELVHELLSYGDSIKVLEPRELIMMMREQLSSTLSLYDNPDAIPGATGN